MALIILTVMILYTQVASYHKSLILWPMYEYMQTHFRKILTEKLNNI